MKSRHRCINGFGRKIRIEFFERGSQYTQGSGKSYSMVFFSQEDRASWIGNWTFLVVTDREDLDDQIYKNFAGAGAVTEPENQVRAESGEHLKQLLQDDHQTALRVSGTFIGRSVHPRCCKHVSE